MRFMTRKRCAPYLVDKVRHWLYYTFAPKTEEVERNDIIRSLPRAMAERLVLHLNEGVLANVPLFAALSVLPSQCLCVPPSLSLCDMQHQ